MFSQALTQLINGDSTVASIAQTCGHTFFGLIPWFWYLPDAAFQNNTAQSGHCTIQNFTILGGSSYIPLIILAIIDDLLRVAGLVAVGLVIYGGIQYITSQGNPQDAAKAQSTITSALIGLVITVLAVLLVSFIAKSLGG